MHIKTHPGARDGRTRPQHGILILIVLILLAAPWALAGTVWNGPLITYNQPAADPTQATNQDRITDHVWLTRTNSGGLFNAVSETTPGNLSPADTEWAFGTITNYASLPYTNWLAWLNGKSPTNMVGSNIVVHLISDDIYLSIKFSLWAAKGSGGFTYQRSTPTPRTGTVWNGPLITFNQPAADPTQATNQDRITDHVWLTRTNSGGLFNAVSETAPGNLSPADTEWAFGTLTNYASLPYTNWLAWLDGKSPTNMVSSNIVVHLITDDIYLSIKFSLWASKGAGGFTYQRSTPTPSTLSGLSLGGGQVSFNYTAAPGFSYVVQSSSDLKTWTPLQTNASPGGAALFYAPFATTPPSTFFRVVRMSGP